MAKPKAKSKINNPKPKTTPTRRSKAEYTSKIGKLSPALKFEVYNSAPADMDIVCEVALWMEKYLHQLETGINARTLGKPVQ